MPHPLPHQDPIAPRGHQSLSRDQTRGGHRGAPHLGENRTKANLPHRTRRVRALTAIPILKQVVYRQIRNKLYSSLGGNFYECIIGGAAFNKEVEDFLHQIRFPYTVGYGMTECGPIIGYEDKHLFVQGSCGKAAPRMKVKIDSPDPQNQPGEILTQGTNVMLGYYKNEEETLTAIDEEGWLHTGDLGTMDSNGNIFIRGRKKTRRHCHPHHF